MTTDHTSELVNALKDIKDTLAAQMEHLKTNSLLLQAFLELNQKEAEKTPAAVQSKDKNTPNLPDVESTVNQRSAAVQPMRKNAPKPPDVKAKADRDSDKLAQLGETTSPVYAKSKSDLIPKREFLPEWKLRDSYVLRIQKEQKGYHIDDHLFIMPRPLDSAVPAG
ncbi:hypothetical protein B0T09DRAFT_310570 [Sordaria sp. MPI-SDFR-AT-0083]|nr:hypothetical protein B0T09DRAFT_310570 [Sordaria sp. MPI-SDFR-AT-0083]